MLDSDLARIYGVTTKRLNEQVRRNKKRFPPDFMFQLTKKEAESLRSHFATSNDRRGGRRYVPFVFTEHGAVMLSAVLNSAVAVEASVQIARAFVKLKQMVNTRKELAKRLDTLEHELKNHGTQIRSLFDAIKELMEPPPKPGRKIGFLSEKVP